ncbi:MAG: hypothetical protein AB1529_06455 [Candidatus Micrarchaeota archaeon]
MATVDDFIARYLGFVDNGIAMIPYKRASQWKEFFFNPTATIAKSSDQIGERMVDLYVISAIELLLDLVGAVPALLLMLIGGEVLSIALVVGIMVAALIVGPPLMFLYSLLELLVAKLVGGVGDMRANFNASALPGLATFVLFLPIMVAAVPFDWLQSIPIISICGSILGIPFSIALLIGGLYSLYLKYLAFKEVHKLSMFRTLAVVFVPVLAMVALLIALVILFYAAMMAVLLGGIGAGNLLQPG